MNVIYSTSVLGQHEVRVKKPRRLSGKTLYKYYLVKHHCPNCDDILF